MGGLAGSYHFTTALDMVSDDSVLTTVLKIHGTSNVFANTRVQVCEHDCGMPEAGSHFLILVLVTHTHTHTHTHIHTHTHTHICLGTIVAMFSADIVVPCATTAPFH
jgi:hypothetical protein